LSFYLLDDESDSLLDGFTSIPKPINSQQSRSLDVNNLWSLLRGSDADGGSPLNWTGHLVRGQQIGGGSFGDVSIGIWQNIPTDLLPPATVVKTMRVQLLNEVEKLRFEKVGRSLI
jgi:hypothetical protein